MLLSIMMPCLNEERTVGRCIINARSFLEDNGLDGEILISDNNSTDHSAQTAESLGARVVKCAETGYGAAVRTGIEAARGEFVIFADCDGSYDFNDALPMLHLLLNGADFVTGNRFNDKIENGAMSFSHRYIGIPLLSFLGRKRYHVAVRDFHCGLRGIRREFAVGLGLRCNGMEAATEMIAEASRAGGRIEETDIAFHRDERDGPSHLHTVRDGFRHLKYILLNNGGNEKYGQGNQKEN